jgi:hypothetical protein
LLAFPRQEIIRCHLRVSVGRGPLADVDDGQWREKLLDRQFVRICCPFDDVRRGVLVRAGMLGEGQLVRVIPVLLEPRSGSITGCGFPGNTGVSGVITCVRSCTRVYEAREIECSGTRHHRRRFLGAGRQP